MISESTKQVLKNYHDASKRLEAISRNRIEAEEAKEEYSQLMSVGRELVSRCILSDDPRNIIALIDELVILLKIVGQAHAAEHLHAISCHLATYYSRFKTF